MEGSGLKPAEVDAMVKKHRQAHLEDSSDEEGNDLDEPRPPKLFVDKAPFQIVIGCCIAINALTIGLETDARSGGKTAPAFWFIIEVMFCLLFAFELVLRLVQKRKLFFTLPSQRAWNVLDIVIVLLSLINVMAGNGGQLRFATMLRFVRLVRLVRLIRLFKIFKELWLVANGLMESCRVLFWVCLIIFLFCYMCAVATTLAIGHNDELYDPYFMASGGWDHEVYFSTTWKSLFTLFQILTLDSWNEDIARHVCNRQPFMLVFFVIFICVTTFGLLNLVIGVVVETTLSAAEKDHNKMKRKQERDRQVVFDQLREIFEIADVDGSGSLSIDEVLTVISKPEIYNKLKMIDFPVEDPKQIFTLLDYDESGELTIDEFVTGCIRMKGAAKSKDLLVAQVAIDAMKRHYAEFDHEMKLYQNKLKKLYGTANALVDNGEHVFLNVREYRMRHPSFSGCKNTMPRVPTKMLDEAPWAEDAQHAGRASTVEELAMQYFNEHHDDESQASFGDPAADADLPHHLPHPSTMMALEDSKKLLAMVNAQNSGQDPAQVPGALTDKPR